MKVFVALLKREWWEHRGVFIWSPLVIFALIVVFGITVVVGQGAFEVELTSAGHSSSLNATVDDDGESGDMGRLLAGLFVDLTAVTDEELSDRMGMVTKFIAAPFFLVLFVVSLFGLIACLYDERKDKSVYFWKSLPVSDFTTVMSKFAFVAWVAPLTTIAVILAAQLFVTFLIVGMVEDGMGSRVLIHSGIALGLVQMLVGYLLNGLVVLPVFAWFILISGWAKTLPMVWTLAIPFTFVVFEGLVWDTGIVRSFIGYHISMPTLPGATVSGDEMAYDIVVETLGDQFAVLGQSQFWIGLLIGILFFTGAVYLRRTRNEI
jgi:ABC-2 type transport system permease protein